MNQYRTMMLFVVLLHSLWGLITFASDDAFDATPLAPFAPLQLPGLLFIGVSVLSLWALRSFPSRRTLLALLPQMLVLTTSAVGSLNAVYVGHYADGVPRPQAFILADQLPIILMAVVYIYAVIASLLWLTRLRAAGLAP